MAEATAAAVMVVVVSYIWGIVGVASHIWSIGDDGGGGGGGGESGGGDDE